MSRSAGREKVIKIVGVKTPQFLINLMNKKIAKTILVALIGILSSLTAQNKIIFSDKPFAGGGTEKTEFTAGTPIYARIVLDKPLKDYCKNPGKKLDNVPTGYSRKLCLQPTKFDLNYDAVYDEILQTNCNVLLTMADLEKNYIDFDVMPASGAATTPYEDWVAPYMSFAASDLELGKKSHFAIKVYSEYNESNSEITDLKAIGDLYIDYTTATSASQEAWYTQCKKAHESASSNALKAIAKNAGADALKLPLPSCFSKGPNSGYKNPENSNAKIIALIKQKYGVSEVLKLTFDKPDGVEDFRTLNDASTNVPTCKMGNHIFYFAFKDKDGTYRFSGGVLRKDHIGYGKFGETYIQDYSPLQGEEKYPKDLLRDSQGIYNVFLFDGAKLK
jgi:hypothetical protein